MKEDRSYYAPAPYAASLFVRPDGVFSESWWPIFTQLPRETV